MVFTDLIIGVLTGGIMWQKISSETLIRSTKLIKFAHFVLKSKLNSVLLTEKWTF